VYLYVVNNSQLAVCRRSNGVGAGGGGVPVHPVAFSEHQDVVVDFIISVTREEVKPAVQLHTDRKSVSGNRHIIQYHTG